MRFVSTKQGESQQTGFFREGFQREEASRLGMGKRVDNALRVDECKIVCENSRGRKSKGFKRERLLKGKDGKMVGSEGKEGLTRSRTEVRYFSSDT